MDVIWQQLRPSDANTRKCWGYRFQLTPEHLTPEQAHPLKYTYDSLGDECVAILNEISPPKPDAPKQEETVHEVGKEPDPEAEAERKKKAKRARRDLYVILKDVHDQHEKLEELWNQVHAIPEWVDWDQIKRGQDVFYRYGGPALTGLAYQSLLGGMGANRVVETLARTGGFSTKVARSRLFETTQHILECTRSLESIQPGGAGFASSIRVRLLHASVRSRIMKLAKENPKYFDVESWGVPINDLDCIATIVSFSSSLIWIGFPRQGIFLRKQEIEDYVALWRLIAYYTGTPTDSFSSPSKAKMAMEHLLMHEISPSPTGAVLASNILSALAYHPPHFPSRSFLEAGARWLNGHDLADALGLGRPGAYYYMLMAGQCMVFMTYDYINRSIPFLDRRRNETVKRIFWRMFVDGKLGLGEATVFEFKYVPALGMMTERDYGEEMRLGKESVEWRYLRWVVVAVLILALVVRVLLKWTLHLFEWA